MSSGDRLGVGDVFASITCMGMHAMFAWELAL